MSLPLPPPALFGPSIQTGHLIILKMQPNSNRSIPENLTITQQKQCLHQTLNAHPALAPFITPKGFRPYWDRFGALIDSWLKCEYNVAA
ncbi:MAG: hypothetical protein Q9199_007472, partial [Rusavskia elegans]